MAPAIRCAHNAPPPLSTELAGTLPLTGAAWRGRSGKPAGVLCARMADLSRDAVRLAGPGGCAGLTRNSHCAGTARSPVGTRNIMTACPRMPSDTAQTAFSHCAWRCFCCCSCGCCGVSTGSPAWP
jgi:hypothetical protein